MKKLVPLHNTKSPSSLLSMACNALLRKDYREAVIHYVQYASLFPEIGNHLQLNTAIARERGLSTFPGIAPPPLSRRAVIFATFSNNGKLPDYVFHYLSALKKISAYIVVVGDHSLPGPELSRIQEVADHTIFKRHGEYDFGSYKRGYFHLLNSKLLDQFDELVFCNDSCYGPLQDFSWIFYEMAGRNHDFWGLTQNSQFGAHLQSFFVVFSKKVFCSHVFSEFMLSVRSEQSVQDVILNYEVGLTRVLAESGFVWDSFIQPHAPGMKTLLARNTNPTVFSRWLLEQGAQLVKVKATRDAGCNVDGIAETLGFIGRHNPELLGHIRQHHSNGGSALEDRPFFSVILPTYDRADCVLSAITSVLAQDYTNFELVIIDDGSTDNSHDLIQNKYSNEIALGKLILIRHTINVGVSVSRNIGLSAARGRWIAYIDSDNTWNQNFLSIFYGHITENPDVPCFYAQSNSMADKHIKGSAYDYTNLLRENYIDLGVFVHRKELTGKTLRFDRQLKRLVDWDFLIRITRDQPVQYIPLTVMNYNDDPVRLDRISVHESYDIALKRIREKNGIPFSASCIVISNGSPDDLTACIDGLSEIDSRYDFGIIIFDNTGSEEHWQTIAHCSVRYPGLIKACRTNCRISHSDNLAAAIGAARGDFIAFASSDDKWVNSKNISKQIQYFIEHPNISVLSEMAPSEPTAHISDCAAPVSSLSRRMYRRYRLEAKGEVALPVGSD